MAKILWFAVVFVMLTARSLQGDGLASNISYISKNKIYIKSEGLIFTFIYYLPTRCEGSTGKY